MVRYILVFMAGFIAAVYCLAPPAEPAGQTSQQDLTSVRPVLVQVASWAAHKASAFVKDLAVRLWGLIEAKAAASTPAPSASSQTCAPSKEGVT